MTTVHEHVDYGVEILADSRNLAYERLTSMLITYPRFVHAEFMTHRVFCLAGDSELEFDLPGVQRGKFRRVFRMRLDEFVDKWLHGARRYGAKPKKDADLSWIESNQTYSVHQIAARLGLASATNLNTMCRRGLLTGAKRDGVWHMTGADIVAWRQAVPENTRFDMRSRLAGMRIRQLNEETGDIQNSHVIDVTCSGMKDVYELVAGDYTVAGSLDHQILTIDGYVRLGDLKPGDLVVVRKYGKKDDHRLDPLRLKKIDGVWRSRWQNKERIRLQTESELCRRCGLRAGVEIHHVVPVYEDPSRAFDHSNVTLLCEECHRVVHAKQGWQGGMYLYGAAVAVERIRHRGLEPTYDLTIAGAFPNFLANGVVVHNSRNSASSRAIPVATMLRRVEEHPVMPVWWGKNQAGMQAREELNSEDKLEAKTIWLDARDSALQHARRLSALNVHKQIVNRLLEPWMWITVIVTSTDWDNFFAQRCHEDAQPEIRKLADMMFQAYNFAPEPRKLLDGEWHLPLIREDEYELSDEEKKKVSVGRCARVSYLTHDGRRDLAADLALHDKLATQNPGHWSPFEHVAMADSTIGRCRNFRGFKPYRAFVDSKSVEE